VVERCTGVNCTSFAQIATQGTVRPARVPHPTWIPRSQPPAPTRTRLSGERPRVVRGTEHRPECGKSRNSGGPTSVVAEPCTRSVTLTLGPSRRRQPVRLPRSSAPPTPTSRRAWLRLGYRQSPFTQTVTSKQVLYRIGANGTGGSSAWRTPRRSRYRSLSTRGGCPIGREQSSPIFSGSPRAAMDRAPVSPARRSMGHFHRAWSNGASALVNAVGTVVGL